MAITGPNSLGLTRTLPAPQADATGTPPLRAVGMAGICGSGGNAAAAAAAAGACGSQAGKTRVGASTSPSLATIPWAFASQTCGEAQPWDEGEMHGRSSQKQKAERHIVCPPSCQPSDSGCPLGEDSRLRDGEGC